MSIRCDLSVPVDFAGTDFFDYCFYQGDKKGAIALKSNSSFKNSLICFFYKLGRAILGNTVFMYDTFFHVLI